ncbi:vegetative cell wall protein gp1 [Sorghum bicolor]|uniref:vegetative cell wall protein gp1 n=1 Tax=Sorghum bicolor TaxID=4558 RepID=UPI000B425E57|nr:vegetative cell wall protein gp1 [Sorghum bicolor]|eukprot:XP_021307216.1 vegetative cell wall protein gp1 [Sorghum bicolor]
MHTPVGCCVPGACSSIGGKTARSGVPQYSGALYWAPTPPSALPPRRRPPPLPPPSNSRAHGEQKPERHRLSPPRPSPSSRSSVPSPGDLEAARHHGARAPRPRPCRAVLGTTPRPRRRAPSPASSSPSPVFEHRGQQRDAPASWTSPWPRPPCDVTRDASVSVHAAAVATATTTSTAEPRRDPERLALSALAVSGTAEPHLRPRRRARALAPAHLHLGSPRSHDATWCPVEPGHSHSRSRERYQPSSAADTTTAPEYLSRDAKPPRCPAPPSQQQYHLTRSSLLSLVRNRNSKLFLFTLSMCSYLRPAFAP